MIESLAIASGLAHDSPSAWKGTWSGMASRIQTAVADTSADLGVDESFLLRRVLLHLPRFEPLKLEAEETILMEVNRLAKKARAAQESCLDGTRVFSRIDCDRSTRVEFIDAELACAIHKQCHYIGVPRTGLHFGLFTSASHPVPVAIATCSELDVEHLLQRLPTDVMPANALLVSRVFAFNWAPRNSISRLFGGVRRWLRANNSVKILFSYVNPNLGFTASSYRASGWRQVGEKDIRYRYLNGDYVTAREFEQSIRYGTHLISSGDWVVTDSKYKLEPLQIWALDIDCRRGLHKSRIPDGHDLSV